MKMVSHYFDELIKWMVVVYAFSPFIYILLFYLGVIN